MAGTKMKEFVPKLFRGGGRGFVQPIWS